MVTMFLSFLDEEMKTHPDAVVGLSTQLITRATRLTTGVTVTDDERLPEDVSF